MSKSPQAATFPSDNCLTDPFCCLLSEFECRCIKSCWKACKLSAVHAISTSTGIWFFELYWEWRVWANQSNWKCIFHIALCLVHYLLAISEGCNWFMGHEEASVYHISSPWLPFSYILLAAEESEGGVEEDIPPETPNLAEMKNKSEIPSLELAGMLRGYSYNVCCLNIITFTSWKHKHMRSL